MSAVRSGNTFESLRRSRNFRLYFGGQAVSLVGTWMQIVAQGWLVLQLTGSARCSASSPPSRSLPVLIFGPLGGVVVDRVDKRRLLVVTQVASGRARRCCSACSPSPAPCSCGWCSSLAVALGVVTVVDNPARQTFVLEIVGPELAQQRRHPQQREHQRGARRRPGHRRPCSSPLVGVGACFLINAASYVAVIVALLMMRPHQLQPTVPARPGEGPGARRASATCGARRRCARRC